MEFSTRDPEVAHAALNALYANERPMEISGDPHDFECSIRFATAGDLGVDRISYSMTADVTMAPAGFFLAMCMSGGAFDDFTVGEEAHRLRRGDVMFYGRGVQVTTSMQGVDSALLRVPFAAIDRVGYERSGLRSPVEFTGVRPASAAAGRQWRTLQHFLTRESEADDSMLDNPLIQAQMTDLVAATALTTFPNSVLADTGAERTPRLAPSAVRRAAAFIEDNARSPITVTQIAEAAGVTPRALQYGFARHLGSSPMGYLRRVRLEHAHRELQAAPPGGGTTVSQVARRWGFTNAGTFAVRYRGAFGQPPSQTLRS
jgi:AraC-like DNA-binding protein